MFRQEEAVIAKEGEEETGKVMSGDDFHIREVLTPGRFYNILTLAGNVLPATGFFSNTWNHAPISHPFLCVTQLQRKSLQTATVFSLRRIVGIHEGNENTSVLPGIPGAQVKPLFSFSQVLSICPCVNTDETGSPPDPGSALLRPTKKHSETRSMFESHLEIHLTRLRSAVEPQRNSPSC